MSLEQALADNTAACHALTIAIQSMGNPFPVAGAVGAGPAGAAAAPAPRGPGRPPKAAAAPATVAAPIAETGDPAGTLYYFNAPHNTVFSVKPGEKKPDVAGVQITPAEFVQKSQAAAAAPAQASLPDPFGAPAAAAASADPFAGPPKTMAEVTAKLHEINGSTVPSHGRAGVFAVLAKHGAKDIGGLLGKNLNEVFADAERLLTTGSI